VKWEACGAAWGLLLLTACFAARVAHGADEEAAVAGESPAIPSPGELEASGAVVGRITVIPDDIFDLSIEGESGWLYRTANRLHMNTRASVIREQLLFETGDRYSDRVVQETERNLRANSYLNDAKIVPVAYDGRNVDLEVRTRDTWTLNPGVNFSRTGGENEYAVQIQEKNLLGRGQSLELEWQSDVDRDALTLSFSDPHLFKNFTRLAVAYSDASDGSTKYFNLDRPFYALDTRWSAGTLLTESEFNVDRWELGKRVGKFETHAQYYQLNGGWSAGLRDGWVRRWTYGATYQQSDFEPVPGAPLGGPLPADRKFVYPWVGFELLQDSFQERVNQDQIRRTEDVLVGFNGWARLGLATESLGSATDAVLASAYASNGRDLSPTQSLFGSAWASGRYEHGEIRNGILGAEARYYLETSARSKFFADLSGTVTEQLDHDQQLTLGGDTGLRGYPFAYQAGTAKALLTLEQRYYTKWYPFRLFHVAGAVFADTGRTWGTDVTGATSLGLLSDVGIGLRLGTSRSAFGNVLHIDLAFPLDGDDDIDSVQLVVATKARCTVSSIGP
jgi:hemolysin activation/secretion protein